MADYGVRPNGTKKGSGWLGELKRPDGSISTELSIQYDDILGGTPIPLLVPTLTKDEINYLLSMEQDSGKIPNGIVKKAIEHALMRDRQGLSPFKVE